MFFYNAFMYILFTTLACKLGNKVEDGKLSLKWFFIGFFILFTLYFAFTIWRIPVERRPLGPASIVLASLIFSSIVTAFMHFYIKYKIRLESDNTPIL